MYLFIVNQDTVKWPENMSPDFQVGVIISWAEARDFVISVKLQESKLQ